VQRRVGEKGPCPGWQPLPASASAADLPGPGAACLNAANLAMTRNRSFTFRFVFIPRPLAEGPG
jgi:hypothetical protein